MREIKFRAWDKKRREMMITGYFDMWYYTLPDKDGTGHSRAIECKDMQDYCRANLIIMQFTGLKDKNGKEIYEGDIVKHMNGYLYIVSWSDINAKWCLIQPRKKDGNTLESVYTGGIDGQDIWRCKIMGNIYENSELLNGGL